ncbi:transmembrane protein 42 isoform X2 [Megalopta genalis]|uniref:transmembrane protein 42 isoform X2 n=1 Tax=Megalopta genalis TaxID=115081 RepID=UPI00144318A5|nr:transmembrane protein 42 isoform X3 [Megalopta genalis]XP_033326199.1 transmembrane protein 42 isoform X4 [Megalopta genalis]
MMHRKLVQHSSSLSSNESDTSSTTTCTNEKQVSKVRLAIVAGVFATVGSLLGKLAGNFGMDSVVGLLLKGVLLILMISSNTIGCTFFVKALNASGSSLPCTIASSATSYVCSALAGFLIFNESTSITWWCGISLVILGLFFISRVPAKSDSTEKLKQK